jgi:hypothetical protein
MQLMVTGVTGELAKCKKKVKTYINDVSWPMTWLLLLGRHRQLPD